MHIKVLHTRSLCKSHELHGSLSHGVRTPKGKAVADEGCDIKMVGMALLEPLKWKASLSSLSLTCTFAVAGGCEETLF